MIILGILMIPGSITAAIGGYFGGRKSGDPARALTAAMLPFLVIASVSMMGLWVHYLLVQVQTIYQKVSVKK